MSDTQHINNELGTAEVVWNLADLYTSAEDSQFLSDINWCKGEAKAIGETYRGTLSTLDAQQLLCIS